MKISKAEIEAVIDRKFMTVLKDAYVPPEKINKAELALEIAILLEQNDYSPRVPKYIIDYDKGHGVSRPVPVFQPLDYVVYYFCIKKLEENIAINRILGTYGGWSLGGKIRRLESAEAIVEDIDYPMTMSLTPEAWARYYGDFSSKIKSYIDELGDDYVAVELDIANFYDTIRLDILEHNIRLVSRKENGSIIDLLFHFLKNCNKQINSFRTQSTGIPQDMIADCSRLLANFYLQDYDLAIKRYCDKRSIKYLRYADDQVFFIPKGQHYKQVVKTASNALYKIGLNVNQKKVFVWDNLSDLSLNRAHEIFKLLDPEKSNKKQSQAVCQKFADSSLAAINDVNRGLKNDGASLLRKIIGLGLEKLSPQTKMRILRLLYSEKYLPYLDHIKLCQLYNSVDRAEKKELLKRLASEAVITTQSAFLYECAKFSKMQKLGKSRFFIAKIGEYNREWTTV